jgi:hypothetical protein
MEKVLVYLEEKRKEYIQHPIFTYLYDEKVDPLEKLTKLSQFLVYFVMAFGDLNCMVLRYTPEELEKSTILERQMKELINKHTEEDAEHWKLFIEDLNTLRIENIKTFGACLEMLWSEEMQASRKLATQLIQYATIHASPIIRYVFIETIEATGNAFFSVSHKVASTAEEKYYLPELRYFGKYHLNLETGHLMTCGCSHDSEEIFTKYLLDTEQSLEAKNVIDKVFKAFSEWNSAMYTFVTNS